MSATARLQLWSEGSTDVMLLNAAMEACPESLAVIENGRIIYANRAFTRMFGFSHTSDVQGRKLTELLPEEDRCAYLGTESTVRSENSSYAHLPFECSSSRLDGTRVHVRTSCASFHINGRNLLVISARDISERKQAEQQWRESQKMQAIGRLVSGVAHDFNNLLTGIMLCCDLLIAGLRSDRRLRYHAEEIRMASEHGTALIQQLLAVARRQVVEPQVLSWNEVISGMRNLLARLIGENIELGTSLAEDLGRVRMDPSQARQIVLNLVLNARDAMAGGGQIALVTMNRGDCLVNSHNPEWGFIPCVELMVMDTGCGMDAETRSHLFEAFFTTKKPGQGNGLGLMTVHTIVKQGGGTIEVESAPGRGTQVFVRLPRLSDGFEALPPVAQNHPVRTGQETGLPVGGNSSLRKPVQQGSERK